MNIYKMCTSPNYLKLLMSGVKFPLKKNRPRATLLMEDSVKSPLSLFLNGRINSTLGENGKEEKANLDEM